MGWLPQGGSEMAQPDPPLPSDRSRLIIAVAALAAALKFLCGVFLALSCQVKIVPLLLFPIFFFYWVQQRRSGWFLLAFAASSLLCCLEPLLGSPVSFARNVLGYGSFWGVTYCLRMTGLHDFSRASFLNLSPSNNGS